MVIRSERAENYPNSKDMRDLAAFEAVQLFTARLRQVKPQVTQFADDLPKALPGCALVEGLPLGMGAGNLYQLAHPGNVRQVIRKLRNLRFYLPKSCGEQLHCLKSSRSRMSFEFG